jgi:sensor histidine kinase regulating citrate/malate metabolism
VAVGYGETLKGEFEMSFKKASIAAVLAASMAATPVLAQTAPAPIESVRSGADMDDASELRGGFIIPLIAIVAIILGILAATSDSDDDLPTSP